MKSILCFLTCLYIVADCGAQSKAEFVAKSSDGRFGIIENASKNEVDPQFYDCKLGSRLGHVFDKAERRQVHDIHLSASWSPKGTNLALVITIGARNRYLALYSRDKRGLFSSVELAGVRDPVEVNLADGKSGISCKSEIALGGIASFRLVKWIAEDCLEVAETHEIEHSNFVRSFAITYRVIFKSNTAQVSKVAKGGILQIDR